MVSSTGLVDELFLTLTPVLTGDETEIPILAAAAFPTCRAGGLRWVLRAEHELFLRYAAPVNLEQDGLAAGGHVRVSPCAARFGAGR